ncbi:MAG: carbohydrate ABC transporter permease [Thermoleophilia bacterium]|nr:carbohydrate ABC transporter permease [Gaiellaceae bacterium]MDW8338417.1 carbohydrate ABC transporter permease [Thermoleophilia bacterium]
MHRYTWRTFSRELSLLVIAAVWWIPFYFLVTIALKPDLEALASPLSFPQSVELGNFGTAWSQGSLGRALVNSIVLTGGTVVILVALGSLCAYTIARRAGAMSTALYLLFVLGIILPFQLGLVPTYAALRELGLVGTYAGLILFYAGIWMPFSVFLYTGFARALPREYEEAAQVDGASQLRIFRKVVFPLLRPVTGTVAIFTGLIIWNDFFLALIFLSGTDNTPLPVAVYSFVAEFASRWNLVFAAVIVALLPVLAFFVVAQRHLIRGFTGGIKT